MSLFPALPRNPKILIVKIGAVGDVVFMLPGLQAIHDVLPQAEISWVVGAQAAPLLEGNRHLKRIHVVSEKAFYSKNHLTRIRELWRLGKDLDGEYHAILIAHRSDMYSLAFRFLTKAYIGNNTVQLSRTTDTPVQLLLRRGVHVSPMTIHETYALRKLVEDGLRPFFDWQKPVFNWGWDFSYIGKSRFDLPAESIGVHLGGGSNVKTEFRLKKWPHSLALVKEILKSTKWSVVLVGAPSETKEADELLAGLPSGDRSRILNLTGQTSLRELVDVIRRLKAFVGPDSGPLHMADALGIPCVGLYGPTSPISWGLVSKQSRVLFEDVSCRPCYKDTGEFPECAFSQRCLVDLKSDRVFRELLGVLGQNALL